MSERQQGARKGGRLGAVLLLVVLSGCATVAQPDPLEPMNRKVFGFNEAVDRAVMRPVAEAYVADAPRPLRRAVGNFFGNLDDGWSALNAWLQGRGHDGLDDAKRFGVNSTIGLLGLADVASDMGLERHAADLGQTLGRWGLAPGAYVVWPLLGPSTLRDSAGLPLQLATPQLLAHTALGATAIGATEAVNTRAGLLGITRLIDSAALDKYSFERDAYLARRAALVCGCDLDPGPSDDAVATPAPAAPAVAR